MLDIGDRLTSYEPLWENWYKDSYIGGGSFGKVYRFRNNVYGQTEYSAVKIITVMLEGDLSPQSIESRKQAMVQEIQNMYRLKDKPHLVQCLNHAIKDIYDDYGRIIGFDILIRMNCYTSLTEYMKMNGPLNEREVRNLALQIADGLRSMHGINMLHRDIKPDNIYMDKSGGYLLGDFGISKQDAASSYSTMAGTQPFIAPEVWRVQSDQRRYTGTADIYSFGITLYYLLNGNRLPLVRPGASVNEIDQAVSDRLAGKIFPSPQSGDEQLNAVVMKCCSYYPNARYQRIEEVIAALKGKGRDQAGGYQNVPGGYQGVPGGYQGVPGGYQGGPGGYQGGSGGYQGGSGGYQYGAGGYQYGPGGYQYGAGGYQSGAGGYQSGAQKQNDEFSTVFAGKDETSRTSQSGEQQVSDRRSQSLFDSGYVYNQNAADRKGVQNGNDKQGSSPDKPAKSADSKKTLLLIGIIAVLVLALILVIVIFLVNGDEKKETSDSKSSSSDSQSAAVPGTTAIYDHTTPSQTNDIAVPGTEASTTTAPTTTTTPRTTTTTKKTTTTTTKKTTAATTKGKITTYKMPAHLYSGIEEGDIYLYSGNDYELYYGPNENDYARTGIVVGSYSNIQEHGRTSDGSWLYVSVYGSSQCGWMKNSGLTQITEYPGMSSLTGYLSPGYLGNLSKDAVFRRGPNAIRDQIPGCNIIKKGSSVQVIGSCPGWYYVYYLGYEGWITSDSVTLTDPL